MQTDLFAILDPPAPAPIHWDWAVPPVDMNAYRYLASEGRAPFNCEDAEYDDAAMRATAEETMGGLVADLRCIGEIDYLASIGRPAFRTPRAWEVFEQDHADHRASLVDSYEGTLDAVAEVWGFAGRDAFDAEARRRACP